VDDRGAAEKEIIIAPKLKTKRPRINDHLKGSPRAMYPALASNIPSWEMGITKDKS
jgi:hypothetical protein